MRGSNKGSYVELNEHHSTTSKLTHLDGASFNELIRSPHRSNLVVHHILLMPNFEEC
jgi:hypothetical protein